MTWGFPQSYVSRDPSRKQLGTEERLQVGINLLGQIGPFIEHGYEDPFNFQLGIALAADLTDGAMVAWCRFSALMVMRLPEVPSRAVLKLFDELV